MDEDIQPVELPAQETDDVQAPENERALVDKLLGRIRGDRAHHAKAFDRMKEDMRLATHGHGKNWPAGNYVANIIGRHVKQKTAALYAKNPKVVARRRETLDFALWDETPDSLMMAYQQVQMAQMQPPAVDPLSGMQMPDPALEQATALLNDFMQGQERREQMRKLGKTLEILYNHSMREQKPLDFKMGMKKLVRRTCTTGVGYVELAFSREYGTSPVTSSKMDDVRLRLAHLENLKKDAAEGDIEDISAEMRELELSMAALPQEELVLVNEGLIFDYPQSTRVIPDKNTMSLVGFVGARHLTVEYLFTVDEVREKFPEAKIDEGYTPFRADWTSESDKEHEVDTTTADSNGKTKERTKDGMIRVYKHFDKATGQVYYLAEGHPAFLRPAAPPDVFVETFWPVFALTFNEVENEDELFPPSDARLMEHQQAEMNRSRQGQREHRIAARPRYAGAKGVLDEDDKVRLANAEAFTYTELNIVNDQKIDDILQVVPVPGVDPNLYETSPFFQDMQLVVGSQQATLGGIAKATATESAIAANSMAASDGSSVDDLDNFLTAVARAGGQILLREMTPERVMTIVGPGAFWPEMTLDQIADELFLEIEAGSTGKPNQAVEIDNWMKLLPMILQMPSANPIWVLRETLRRLDDKMDVTEAIIAGVPSIAMQNQGPQANMIASEGGPANNPAAQGAEGANNAPAGPPMEQRGSGPAFGSNQTA